MKPVISHPSKAFCSQLTSQPLFISAELFEEDTSCLDSLKTHMSNVMIWQLLLLVVAVCYRFLLKQNFLTEQLISFFF